MNIPIQSAYDEPHLGVYAVAFNPTNTHILLIYKSRGPYAGRFDLPGGKIERGESLEAALRREVQEETGLEILEFTQACTEEAFFPYTSATGEERIFHHIGILYHMHAIAGEIKKESDGHDSNGCSWICLSRINALNSTPFVQKILQYSQDQM